jgi:acetate kinase
MDAIKQGNSRAQLAFDMYVHSLRKHIGAMLATLGGLDALVFSGGVGKILLLCERQRVKPLNFWDLNLT